MNKLKVIAPPAPPDVEPPLYQLPSPRDWIRREHPLGGSRGIVGWFLLVGLFSVVVAVVSHSFVLSVSIGRRDLVCLCCSYKYMVGMSMWLLIVRLSRTPRFLRFNEKHSVIFTLYGPQWHYWLKPRSG